MSEKTRNSQLDRRSLILGAILLVGGGAALTRFVRDPGERDSPEAALSADQFSLLEHVTDVMIPPTDTPGAIGAGVPEFLRGMLTHWATSAARAEFIGVIEAMDKLAWSRFGAGFLEQRADRRLEVVRTFDQAAIEKHDEAYGKFKFLVLCGYYQSEVGATQELRYELVPGAWRACLPLTEVGRASAV